MHSFLTVDDIAELFKVSKPIIYKMARNGEIPAFKIANKWRFNSKEIFVWSLDGKEVIDALPADTNIEVYMY